MPAGEKLVDYGGHDEAVAVAVVPAVAASAAVPALGTEGATALAATDSVDAMNQKIKRRARRDARNKGVGKFAEENSETRSTVLGSP